MVEVSSPGEGSRVRWYSAAAITGVSTALSFVALAAVATPPAADPSPTIPRHVAGVCVAAGCSR